jgi:hypothetical protein
MTIPTFTSDSILTAGELNTALSDTAAQAITDMVAQVNTFADAQTFDAGLVSNALAKGVAPAQFDAGSSLITSAFAQQLVGGFSGFTYSGISGSGTGTASTNVGGVTTNWPITGLTTQLGAAAYGTECQLYGSVANTTTYLPDSAPNEGFGIFFKNDSPYPQIVAASQSGAYIYAPAFGYGTSNTQVTLQPGMSLFLMNRGGGEWDAIHGTWMTSGYAKSNQMAVGSTTTVGDITLSAADIGGKYFADGAVQTAAFTATTDTAANILAQVKPIIVGGSFKFRFINNDQSSTGYAGTLAGGTGVTIGTILPNPAVGQGNWCDYVFTFTAVGSTPTITVEAVGGSSLGLL